MNYRQLKADLEAIDIEYQMVRKYLRGPITELLKKYPRSSDVISKELNWDKSKEGPFHWRLVKEKLLDLEQNLT